MHIKQLFFDCDNTLVLSEELAFEVCADLCNEILAGHGIIYRYTGDLLIEKFIGQNFRGMMLSLQSQHNFTMSLEETAICVKKEEDAVIAKLEAKALPCVDANQVVEKLFDEKRYGLAVVSSSALRRLRASLAKAGQEQWFPYDHIFSATTSLPKPTTKPNPAIYFHAMETIGVKPVECVAVEDSKSGADSAVQAGIATIAYVGSYPTEEKQNQIADVLLECGCKKVMYNWTQFPTLLKEIEDM